MEIKKPEISDDDIIEAMRALPGYIDLTVNDFKLLYEEVYHLARVRLLTETKAGDLMTTPAVTIGEEATVLELAALLSRRGLSGLPVVDQAGRLKGVVSEKDVLRAMGEKPTAGLMCLAVRALEGAWAGRAEGADLKAGQIMSAPPVSVTLWATLEEVARLFQARAINRLPVVDESGGVCGIITRSNLIGAFLRL